MRSASRTSSIDDLCNNAFHEIKKVVKTISLRSEDQFQVGVYWTDSLHAKNAQELYKKLNAALGDKGYVKFLFQDRSVSMASQDDKAILELIVGGMLAKELMKYSSKGNLHMKKVRASKRRTTLPPASEAPIADELFNTGCPHQTRAYHEIHGLVRGMINKGHYAKVFGYLEKLRKYYCCT